MDRLPPTPQYPRRQPERLCSESHHISFVDTLGCCREGQID